MKLFRVTTALALVSALLCAGCAMVLDDNSAVYSSLPGKYDYLDCKGIAEYTSKSVQRSAELNALMERAKQDAGGTLVSNIMYRDEYNTTQADQQALRKASDDKRCPPSAKVQPASLTPMH